MVTDLNKIKSDIERNNEERVEFGEGYTVSYGANLTAGWIAYSKKTELDSKAHSILLQNCVEIDFEYLKADGVFGGTAQVILDAINDGRIRITEDTKPKDAYQRSVYQGKVLFLSEEQAVLFAFEMKSGGLNVGYNSNGMYHFKKEERKEAIDKMIEVIMKKTHHLMDKHNIKDRDKKVIAEFISKLIP